MAFGPRALMAVALTAIMLSFGEPGHAAPHRWQDISPSLQEARNAVSSWLAAPFAKWECTSPWCRWVMPGPSPAPAKVAWQTGRMDECLPTEESLVALPPTSAYPCQQQERLLTACAVHMYQLEEVLQGTTATLAYQTVILHRTTTVLDETKTVLAVVTTSLNEQLAATNVAERLAEQWRDQASFAEKKLDTCMNEHAQTAQEYQRCDMERKRTQKLYQQCSTTLAARDHQVDYMRGQIQRMDQSMDWLVEDGKRKDRLNEYWQAERKKVEDKAEQAIKVIKSLQRVLICDRVILAVIAVAAMLYIVKLKRQLRACKEAMRNTPEPAAPAPGVVLATKETLTPPANLVTKKTQTASAKTSTQATETSTANSAAPAQVPPLSAHSASMTPTQKPAAQCPEVLTPEKLAPARAPASSTTPSSTPAASSSVFASNPAAAVSPLPAWMPTSTSFRYTSRYRPDFCLQMPPLSPTPAHNPAFATTGSPSGSTVTAADHTSTHTPIT